METYLLSHELCTPLVGVMLEVAYDIALANLRRYIREAIKEWIRIDIAKTYPVAGGISGAGVHYVSAYLSFPGLSIEKFPVDFVVKFSEKRTFDLEQQKYMKLSDEIKQYFINFTAITKQITDEFCMIMEHLKGFQTLELILYTTPMQVGLEDLMQKVVSVLGSVHKERVDSDRLQNVGKQANAFRLYLTDIANNIYKSLKKHGTILTHLYDQNLIVNGSRVSSLQESFAQVCENWKRFNPGAAMTMHGDCHARNIMVNPRTLDLKFIDIDKMDERGDYIYDFGELLADLETFGYILGTRRFSVVVKNKNNYDYSIEPPNTVKEACIFILNRMNDLNENDKRRLKLAKARYLLGLLPDLSSYDNERVVATYLEAVRIMNDLANSLR